MKKYSNLMAMGLLSVCCANLQSCDNQEEKHEYASSARQKPAEQTYAYRLAREELDKDSLNAVDFYDVKILLIENIYDELIEQPFNVGNAISKGFKLTKSQCEVKDKEIVNKVARELDAVHAQKPLRAYSLGETPERMRAFWKDHPQVLEQYPLYSEDRGLKIAPEFSNMRKFYRIGRDFISALPTYNFSDFDVFLVAYAEAKDIPFADNNLMSQNEIKEIQGRYRALMNKLRERPNIDVLEPGRFKKYYSRER